MYSLSGLSFAFFLVFVPAITFADFKKCFTCRSRGELGDCRDPFFLTANSTRLLSKAAGVETPECASGWCSKTVEGLDNLYKDAEYGVATERGCLLRAPSDYRERCARVKRSNKWVMMCFCKGNLCNASSRQQRVASLLLLLLPIGTYVRALLNV